MNAVQEQRRALPKYVPVTPEQIVGFTEGLARIAGSGGGPKALAAHLADATAGGVLLEDARWRHVAAAGPGPMPSSGRAISENGAPGRCIRVALGSAELGWLSVFPRDGAPLSGDCDYFMRLAAAAIAVELARASDGGRGRQRGFWERLLAQTYHDVAAARDDAAANGIALAPAYLTVALEPESADAAAAAELRALAGETFLGGDAHLGLLERGATLLVFVPAPRELDASNARTAARLLPTTGAKRKIRIKLSGGVGPPAPLLGLHESVAAAQAALAIGRLIHGGGHVAVYEELGVYPLLYEGAEVKRLKAFAERTLAPLRAYDEKHQTELERTLGVYFAEGQNVKTAAERLHVHRHTVFYRLRQIAEICRYSLESPHDQLTLRLAVAVDALHTSI